MNKEQLLAIERPHSICADCGGSIDELDRHPTRLKIEEEQPRRQDFCPDCWAKLKEEAYDIYWLTKREKKEKPIPKLSRREKAVAARALFESLWDQRDREDVESDLYFLSHLLMKWGGLKWLGEATDETGREQIKFENPVTGDAIEIRSTPLSEEQINAIRERLENFLREYAPENEIEL